jgi:hypothetical protein
VNRRMSMLVVLVALAGCSGQVGSTPGGVGGSTDRPGEAMASAAPATGPRLTDRQYLNVIADLFGVDVSAETLTMPLDPKVDGFRNAASALLPSDLRIEGYATLARSVARQVDWGQLLSRGGVCADFNDGCRKAFFAVIGRRLFRRPLSTEQVARFAPLFDAVAREGDPFPLAAGLVVVAMLQSPELLYRLESGPVDDFALATRLSFLLWNSTPDDALLDAAAHAQLTGAALHAQITRMLADDRAHRALRDYVDDWLDADKLLRTSRDPALFPQFSGALAGDMREEIHRLFARVVWQDDADLVGVLRAEHTMITPALARLYGLAPPSATDGFADQDLSQTPNRSGLLTQAGILTITSVGGPGSSIVDRGLFVLRNFMCRTTPEPPSNVPDLPSADSGKSERDRLAQHRTDPVCASCHSQFDPLGIAFERYDAIGALQTMDAGGNRLTGAGTLTVNGQDIPYNDVREFVSALTRSTDVGACLARKVLQYAFARPLAAEDEAVITELSTRFAQGGHRYQGLLASLAEGAWMRRPGVSP